MKNSLRLETPRVVRVRSVIEVEAARGQGEEGDPIRIVTQYWSDDGKLLAEHDPSVLPLPHVSPKEG